MESTSSPIKAVVIIEHDGNVFYGQAIVIELSVETPSAEKYCYDKAMGLPMEPCPWIVKLQGDLPLVPLQNQDD